MQKHDLKEYFTMDNGEWKIPVYFIMYHPFSRSLIDLTDKQLKLFDPFFDSLT